MTIYAVSASVLLVLVAGPAVLDAEQNVSGANITTFGDAIWWAFSTITTVGYGDYFPVTLVGRLVAVGLMVSGVALLGTITATIASWFIELVRQPERTPDSDS
ncbi:potassium channel family protein [Salinibacterium sp. G-O1]|uniref:potassium channel family protein n=1 Tax=Salinibacterium sp. G-O1 TaxID=3046208 RepID=UPI0024BB98CC|nr:potassium channel family protein [Salinibacterium sp. G-O1]MDJ0335565.1 potassium channel family protein [Salinibacterium sp. G-O1]